MISVSEALTLILQQTRNFGTEQVPLLQAANRTLAQPVIADRDFPPFNRVMMDGVAINAAAFEAGARVFPVQAVQGAGQPAQALINPQHCIEVMTGAVMPGNTSAVIRYEDCTISNHTAAINLNGIELMQHVHLQGTDSKAGEMLIHPNQPITPAMVAVMAAVGLEQVSVHCLPRIAIIATGDELVEINQQPALHQIRQSNSYMLASALMQEGIRASRYHLPDDPQRMKAQLGEIVEQYDALLFSGAVSKGKYDYLPQILAELGMQQLFHSIAQRPGKPFLFGILGNRALVFAFPGNPVSTFVCYQLYFKAWLYQNQHRKIRQLIAHLTREVTFKPLLAFHMLARVSWHEGEAWITPVGTSTSGDMVTLLQADALISLPAGQEHWPENSLVQVQLLAVN